MARQEFYSVDHCASERKQPHFSEVHDGYPGLYLALNQAVLSNVLEEVTHNIVKHLLFYVRFDDLWDVNH
jgi:hypothetical protein